MCWKPFRTITTKYFVGFGLPVSAQHGSGFYTPLLFFFNAASTKNIKGFCSKQEKFNSRNKKKNVWKGVPQFHSRSQRNPAESLWKEKFSAVWILSVGIWGSCSGRSSQTCRRCLCARPDTWSSAPSHAKQTFMQLNSHCKL